ncbi:hypothetical protein RR46_14261 [Papilio xuthus]|uniref:Uncharacterized protein n=1 Tax=Papilio xuthus TaxID=66420 RepID=A0A194PPH8_PAPXU|nr:hypothetical protein RR46_14261 [Papilio xuthus]
MSVKKSGKLNFMSDDLDESNFLKISPKNKKVQKRQRIEAQEEGNSTANNITAYKKKKNIENKEIGSEPRQKLVNVMNDQILTRCEEMEVDHKAETDKLGEELEEDMRKLQENLVSKIKRNEWENLQKTFFQAMRNNF